MFLNCIKNYKIINEIDNFIINPNWNNIKNSYINSLIRKRVNLKPFENKNTTFYINGSWRPVIDKLLDQKEYEWMRNYITENDAWINNNNANIVILDSLNYRYEKLYKENRYVKDIVDGWFKPSKLCENNFYGDCDDYAIFMFYFIICQLEFNNLLTKYGDRLYLNLTPMNTNNGWASNLNHASLLWESIKDNNFYVVESNTSYRGLMVEKSIEYFGEKDINNRIEYGKPVILANIYTAYRNPILIK